jgi:hypothetical protein
VGGRGKRTVEAGGATRYKIRAGGWCFGGWGGEKEVVASRTRAYATSTIRRLVRTQTVTTVDLSPFVSRSRDYGWIYHISKQGWACRRRERLGSRKIFPSTLGSAPDRDALKLWLDGTWQRSKPQAMCLHGVPGNLMGYFLMVVWSIAHPIDLVQMFTTSSRPHFPLFGIRQPESKPLQPNILLLQLDE